MTINHILTITYPVILMVVFARQLCLPLPARKLLRCYSRGYASTGLTLGERRENRALDRRLAIRTAEFQSRSRRNSLLMLPFAASCFSQVHCRE